MTDDRDEAFIGSEEYSREYHRFRRATRIIVGLYIGLWLLFLVFEVLRGESVSETVSFVDVGLAMTGPLMVYFLFERFFPDPDDLED